MKARRQRDLMMALTFLFEEFVGAGTTSPPPPPDPNGTAQTGDDPPPLAAPPTKRHVATKPTRRPAR